MGDAEALWTKVQLHCQSDQKCLPLLASQKPQTWKSKIDETKLPAVETWQRQGGEATAPTIPEKAEANWICPISNILGDKIKSEGYPGTCPAVAQLKGFEAKNPILQGTVSTKASRTVQTG